MNDLMTLLYYLNREEAGSQRDMAQATNLSLGKINLILKRLDEQGYIEIERQGTRNHLIVIRYSFYCIPICFSCGISCSCCFWINYTYCIYINCIMFIKF